MPDLEPDSARSGSVVLGHPLQAADRTPIATPSPTTHFHFYFYFLSINIPYFHSFLTQLLHISQPSHNISSIQYLSFTHFSKMFPREDISRAMERAMFVFGNQILTCIRAIQEQEQAEQQVLRPICHRTSVRREHGLARQRLFEDYFADEPRWGPTVFHR